MRLKPATRRFEALIRLGFLYIGIVILGGISSPRRFITLTSRQGGSQLLAELTGARKIRVADDWTGLSRVAPLAAHFTLERGSDGFRGQANFSAGGYSGEANTASEDVAVPFDKVELFLQMVSKCPLKSGEYEPKIEHTDDYPSIHLEIELEKETIVFFTRSQGETNIPWGVTIGGRTYVIESDIPAKALETLKPYLKYDTMERVKRGVGAGPSPERARAIVAIESNWQLLLASTGALIYQQTVANRDTRGKELVPGGSARVPVFYQFADGAMEPALTRRAANGIAIRNKQFGTGVAVTTDGFVLTSRTVSASWEASYKWDARYYGSGAVVYVLNASLKPERSRAINYDQLPDNWVPANSRMVDGRRIEGRDIEGHLIKLFVRIPRTKAVLTSRLIKFSHQYDLAIIKVDSPEPMEPLKLDDDDQPLSPGEPIVVLSYTEVPPNVVDNGKLVNHTDEKDSMSLITSAGTISEVLETYQLSVNAPISGSPVFLKNGKLIGLLSQTGKPSSAAVPIRYAKALMRARF